MAELARLPELTEDELNELHIALKLRLTALGEALHLTTVGAETAQTGSIIADTHRRGLICQSLDTAVQEARYSLRRAGERDHPSNEAWQPLEDPK